MSVRLIVNTEKIPREPGGIQDIFPADSGTQKAGDKAKSQVTVPVTLHYQTEHAFYINKDKGPMISLDHTAVDGSSSSRGETSNSFNGSRQSWKVSLAGGAHRTRAPLTGKNIRDTGQKSAWGKFEASRGACSRLRVESRNEVGDCIVDTTRRLTEDATWIRWRPFEDNRFNGVRNPAQNRARGSPAESGLLGFLCW